MPPAALTAPPPRVTEPVRYPASFEAFQALPEGTRAQYLDGHVYMSPAPLRRHQDVVLNLAAALRAYAIDHGGYVAVAPIDVFLAGDEAVQPDVVYVAADRRDRLSERGVEGAPTFVAEVLSPSTAYLDVSRKRRAYEEAGVEEYWVLDPAERSAEVLTATDDGLRTTARVYESGAVASGALAGFAVDAADLSRRP